MNNKQYDNVYGKIDALVIDQKYGYGNIIHHLAIQTFRLDDSRLNFEEKVSEVHYELENDKNVPFYVPKYGVYVKTTNGNEYWAQYCIITFTVGTFYFL